jgi:membrane associated rhomboid family serine protease
MRLQYNAPVTLTFALIATAVVAVNSFTGNALQYWFSFSPSAWSDWTLYPRLITYIAGHADWNHLLGNFSLILVVGPLLEEKFGSQDMLIMMGITAVISSLSSIVLFGEGGLGASGIVFMYVLLASFANIKQKRIPLTFVLVFALWIGKEIMQGLQSDNVSQFGHIIGGVCGSLFGFLHRSQVGNTGSDTSSTGALL